MPPVKLYYALAVLAAANIADLYLMHKLKKTNREIAEINQTLADMVIESEARVLYLAQLLDQHEIDLDEFDLIALSNPM